MRVLITGSDGFIGRHLVIAHLEMGHQVTGCIRNAENVSARI